jgi:predicted AlkP superfamily pyrophosphatase or phosphodiesterase
MKKIFSLVVSLLLALTVQAQVARPKLVVGIVVDQMRWDYLYYYYNQFGTGGLRRLVDEGFNFDNCTINYVPTVTAIGHSSIYTGSVPALTGIAGNNFYIDGKKTYCCSDSTVKSVGSNSKEGQMSPHNLLTTTIGDMLKMATDGQAKVYGVALKDRAAILPAGHSADAAYWWDASAGHYVSSTYYMDRLPKWVEALNKKVATKPGTDVKTSVPGVTKTFQMAEAVLDNEQLGQDSITDLLAISVSSTDAIGHTYGTRGQENHDVYMELDRQLASFFSLLDAKVGRGNYLVFLSADHGACHNPNVLRSRKIPAGGTELYKVLPDIEKQLEAQTGISGKIISDEDANRLYLDHDLIAKSGKTLCEVKQKLADLLMKLPSALYVVDYDKALTTPMPQVIREMVVNGYNWKRSGDLFYIAKADWEDVSNAADYRGTTHGMWNPYDSHIPFVMMGWHVSHGESVDPVHIVDIAPTVCAMLHIQMPGSCIGTARLPKE